MCEPTCLAYLVELTELDVIPSTIASVFYQTEGRLPPRRPKRGACSTALQERKGPRLVSPSCFVGWTRARRLLLPTQNKVKSFVKKKKWDQRHIVVLPWLSPAALGVLSYRGEPSCILYMVFYQLFVFHPPRRSHMAQPLHYGDLARIFCAVCSACRLS